MPRNFKEALLFTTLMCSMMVLGMSMWNLFIVGQLSLHHLSLGYIPGFVTAFLLDVILVGPIVKSIAFRILTEHHKGCQKIITISGGMAVRMVTFMSFYGLFYNGIAITPKTYLGAWIVNFIAALPLNFLIVGPIARFILSSFQFCKLLTFEIHFLLGYNDRNEFLRGKQ